VAELIITVKIFRISATSGSDRAARRWAAGLKPAPYRSQYWSGAIAAAPDCVYNPRGLIFISPLN
jgi:hypothetical protein